MPRLERSTLNMLMDKTKMCPVSGCWEWTGWKNPKGYGRISVDGVNRSVHRVSYEKFREHPVTGMLVCHTCDKPACWNPDHLFLGTHADNMDDMVRKGRQHRPHGAGHPRAKLTEADVVTIRSAVGITNRRLAELYGVSKWHVAEIRRGKWWTKIATQNVGESRDAEA